MIGGAKCKSWVAKPVIVLTPYEEIGINDFINSNARYEDLHMLDSESWLPNSSQRYLKFWAGKIFCHDAWQ